MTAVTVISEPRSMCSVPMPQDPAPLSASRSPTWGEGQFTGSHSTKMETEAQEAEGAARGPATGSAGVRTEPRVLQEEASPDQMRGSQSRQLSDRRPGTLCTCWSALTSPSMHVLFPQPGVGIRLPAHWSLESRDVTGLKSAGSFPPCPLCPLWVAPKPPSSSSLPLLPAPAPPLPPRLTHRASVSSDTLRAPPPADPSSDPLIPEPDLAHLSPISHPWS